VIRKSKWKSINEANAILQQMTIENISV